MKKFLVLFIFTFILINGGVQATVYIIGNDTIHFENDEYFVIGRTDTFSIDTTLIFVKYSSLASSMDKTSIESAYHITKDYESSFGWTSYTYSQSNETFIDLASGLNNESLIEMVDFNTSIHYACDAIEPSDYYFSEQWYLNQISAPYAWAITTGDPDVIVAIIDSGFDWEHPDLGPGDDSYDNIYLNEDETNGGEDAWDEWDEPTTGDKDDNDNNGFIDDWKGWGEMYDSENYPVFFLGNDVRNYSYDWLYDYLGYAADAEIEWMHGTFVAGIIGAKTNNDGEGISGIAGGWNNKGASLLFFKSGLSEGPGLLASTIVLAIDYVTTKLPHAQKASIIEMAFTTYDWNDYISTAINNAHLNHNVFFVAAAGYHSQGHPYSVGFPASHPYVFAVGATDEDDIRIPTANYGAALDLSAPGLAIDVIVPKDDHDPNGYQTIDGNTSAASAMVAGAAALILAVNPDLDNSDIADILRNSADQGTYYTYDDGHNDEIGHGRLNVYKAVCMAGLEYSQSYPEEITSDETWSNNRSYMNSVHVKDGAFLTITSEIQFGPEAKLIIEPGGIVRVDGGILTNLKCCDNEYTSWPGIEVWGNRNESQYTEGAQGKLIMLHGATIENAVTAVDLWKPGFDNMTGGIIDAEDAIFLNNARSIHAINYRNFIPDYINIELDYYGTFSDCSFILDLNYLGYKTFYKHIDLDRVRGIKFYGCSFSLSHEAVNVSQWNLGIAAYNAGFNVLPVCASQIIPCPEYDSCRFDGFEKAIGSFNSTLIDYPVLIINAHFDDNNYGVFLSSTDYSVVINNFFEAGYDAPYVGNCGFANGVGIDIQTSNGFVVENNRLRKNSQALNGTYAGIRVFSCPSENDIIYKNELIGLSYGNYAQGTNRGNPLDDGTGVEYQCNYNSHNAVDFIVTNNSLYDGKIRGWHGSADSASGNVFTRYTPTIWHFRNEGLSTINYYYCDPCTDEEPVNIYTIRPEYFEKIKSPAYNCPDHYGNNGHIVLNEIEKDMKETAFIQNLNDYNSVEYLYESLIDGGDPETELSDIQTAEEEDMWELRNQLLGHSPHLSQEALRAVSDRTDIFPDNILLEILAANPDELNRDTLLTYLEQKENPLPDYMISILQQAVEGVTYKTILEEDMARYHAGKTQAAQDMIRNIMFDTVFDPVEYRNWLGNMNSQVADRQIISSYLSELDTTSAMTLINLLPSLYDLTGESLEEFYNYKTLVEMQLSWISQGSIPGDLDSLEIIELESIAADSGLYAGNMARNILEYANVHHYCNCLQMTDTAYLKSNFNPGMNTRPEDHLLKISTEPNPAHTFVAFNYELMTENSSGLVTISDITGKVVYSFNVHGNIGQHVWNITGTKAGVYYYLLTSEGLSKSGKVVIY